MIATQQSLGTVKLLLSQAAVLCRQQRKQLLLYFISMALAELDSELADPKDASVSTQH